MIQIAAFILVALASLYLLVKSAGLVEETLVFVSDKIKINGFFMGFVLLGIASNLPELAIALNSADSAPQLAIGNLLGSSLIALTFIVGLSALRFGNIDFKGRFGRKEVFATLAIIQLMVIVLLDRELSFFDGVLLLSSYLLFVGYIYLKFGRVYEKHYVSKKVEASKTYVLGIKSLIGIVLLLISANLLVSAIVGLGTLAHIHESLIGLLILGIGTNTPELAMLLLARNIKQRKLAFGNFLGSAFVISGIMGVFALTSRGVRIEDFSTIVPALVIMSISVLLFLIFSWNDKKLSKMEGSILIAVYMVLPIAELIRAIWFS